MQRPSAFLWLAIALLILLPTTAGRFLLDLVGGLMVVTLLVPVLLGIAAWIGWKKLKADMVTCQACGMTTFAKTSQCPVCGSSSLSGLDGNNASDQNSSPASAATIDVKAEDIGKE